MSWLANCHTKILLCYHIINQYYGISVDFVNITILQIRSAEVLYSKLKSLMNGISIKGYTKELCKLNFITYTHQDQTEFLSGTPR